MSKEMWDELEGELVEDLAAAIREKNGMVMIHNCGERIYFDAQIKRMQPEDSSRPHRFSITPSLA